MVLYECKICKFSSIIKTHFIRHQNTKKHGKNIKNYNENYNELILKTQKDPKKTQKDPEKTQKDPQNANDSLIFNCDYCDDSFSTYAHKRRHELHRCKKIYNITDNINKIKKLEKEKLKLEKKVDKLTDRIGNTTNIQNNTNIEINSYGNEDLSHITDAFKTSLLCGGPYGAIPKMIEAIHFNKDKPENNNIVLPNLNKNILKIKKGGEWIYKQKDMILYDLIDSKYLMLDEHFNLIVNGDKLSKYKKDIYTKFRDKYDDGNPSLINNIKEDCDLLLLNNRNEQIKKN